MRAVRNTYASFSEVYGYGYEHIKECQQFNGTQIEAVNSAFRTEISNKISWSASA